MTELSPATREIWQAFKDAPDCAENKLAAALRAAAEQLGEKLEFYNARVIDAEDLLAIADELEAQ